MDSKIFTNFADAMIAASQSLRGNIPSFLTFIQRRHKLSIFMIELSWRRFRIHFEISGIILKFTKFSPFLQIYLVNNQLFKSFWGMLYNMLLPVFDNPEKSPFKPLEAA